MSYKLLIVDDELANLRLLERLFSRDYECLTASSGEEAVRLLEQHDVAILLSDQRMPGMTGIDLLRHTARLRPHMVRILLTGYTDVEVLEEAINSGLVYMYVTKPWNNEDLKLKVSRACDHYESNKKSSALVTANSRLLGRLQEIKLRVVASLSEMLRVRDEYAHSHAIRVRNYTDMIARKMDLSEFEIEELSAAAMLHELGDGNYPKVSPHARAFSDSAMSASAHAETERKLLASIPDLANVSDFIKFYRENYDGSGAPSGLAADQIPLLSRILRVAVEYDLMVQPKPPAASMRHEEAMRFLSQRSGKQFDPQIIEIMAQLSDDDLPHDSTSSDESFSQFDEDTIVESAHVDAMYY
ncbi:MAG TPA: HD domain-containing phosphohydrolase [Pyrinomonadaceae bacterium]|jgi:response regulator RpfG family c-di-GMP phosphodiesterase|nr:HD domain-containing phosphohydrolase [Pyrinomonadaceae bacterium]